MSTAPESPRVESTGSQPSPGSVLREELLQAHETESVIVASITKRGTMRVTMSGITPSELAILALAVSHRAQEVVFREPVLEPSMERPS